MRRRVGWALLPALVLAAPVSSGAAAATEEPLEACFDAVGTYLTTNVASEDGETQEVGRSLISFTNGGHAFLTDSNEAGLPGYAPFTEGRGAWRCVSDRTGRLHVRAIILDFTLTTEDEPTQHIARLDYDATYDAETEVLSADVKLYFVPLDGDPLDDDALGDPSVFSFSGVRVMPR